VTLMLRYRIACLTAALTLCSVVFSSSVAQAGLLTVIGPRTIVPNKPLSDCSARAKSALDTVLQNSFEAGAGSGEWIGAERLTPSSDPSASAVIECHPVDTGYAASFTCAAEVPPSPVTASDLCNKLIAAFGAQQTAAIGGASWH
jgi:hypothetical protein